MDPTPRIVVKYLSRASSLLCNLITKRALIVLFTGILVNLLYC